MYKIMKDIIPFPSAAMSFCKYKLRLNTIITKFFGDFSPIYAAKVILLFEMRKKIVNKITTFIIKMINTIIL